MKKCRFILLVFLAMPGGGVVSVILIHRLLRQSLVVSEIINVSLKPTFSILRIYNDFSSSSRNLIIRGNTLKLSQSRMFSSKTGLFLKALDTVPGRQTYVRHRV